MTPASTTTRLCDTGRLTGEGTIDQIIGDLEQLRRQGSDTVLLDPFGGGPLETCPPQSAWQALATVAAHWDLRTDLSGAHRREEQP